MRYEFTPAAGRALRAAAGWGRAANARDVELPEVLLGLLAEPECRAALLLAACGIDAAAVREHWPGLVEVPDDRTSGDRRFSPALAAAIDEAEQRFWEYPRPFDLATEHLLLGILA